MTEFTIIHRGLPIGTASTTPRSEADPGGPFEFCFLDFRPLPTYEGVGPIVRLASQALANFGFLGPAANPASDAAGRAAYAAAQSFWDELELADASGRPIAGRVVWFLEHTRGGQASYWVDVELDEGVNRLVRTTSPS